MRESADAQAQRVDETLRLAAERLAKVVGGPARLEAELLLMLATGCSRAHLMAWPEQGLTPEIAAEFSQLLDRRLAGEPIAYIRGRQAFWTFDLEVTPDTLIPRPETELLVETALERIDAGMALSVADLGTGSGAIAAALASERPHWQLIASDRCASALAVARSNFSNLGLDRIAPLQGHWLGAFAIQSLDLIVSNPPYVAAADPHLQRGDLRFEPPRALSSGSDGLNAIRAIVAEIPRCLRPGGWLLLEHGFDQGPAVRQLLTAARLQDIETLQDLARNDRITLGRI